MSRFESLLDCYILAIGQSRGCAIDNVDHSLTSYSYQNCRRLRASIAALSNFSSEALTNGGIMSPIVSYQYYEWPGNGILNLQYSPTVSYYYQFLDAPVLNIISTTPDANYSRKHAAYLISPPRAFATYGISRRNFHGESRFG